MAATAAGDALSRQEQDRMCRSKRKYRRENDAITAAVRSQRGGMLGARVYRCPVCPGWHVSTGKKVC